MMPILSAHNIKKSFGGDFMKKFLAVLLVCSYEFGFGWMRKGS